MMTDIYVHISNLIETIFFCEHCKKYRNFTQSLSVEILRKRTVENIENRVNVENRAIMSWI